MESFKFMHMGANFSGVPDFHKLAGTLFHGFFSIYTLPGIINKGNISHCLFVKDVNLWVGVLGKIELPQTLMNPQYSNIFQCKMFACIFYGYLEMTDTNEEFIETLGVYRNLRRGNSFLVNKPNPKLNRITIT